MKEKCPNCGNEDFLIARDMKSTRHCKCGHEWLPEGKKMRKEFEVHVLNDTGKLKAKQIAEAFNKCLVDLENICRTHAYPSREFSLVRTKMEEACFFAKKAMACQLENAGVERD